MRPITSRLAGNVIFWLPLYWLFRKLRHKLIGVLVLSSIMAGCYQHYYKAGTRPTVTPDLIQRMQALDKYFILHQENQTLALKNVRLTNDVIEADLETLAPVHTKALNPSVKSSNLVKKNIADSVLMEVHLYSNQQAGADRHISLPLSRITRMDVYEVDAKRTRTSKTVSTIGVVIVTSFLVGVIALAIACNCPQVYVDANGQQQFNGGLYSGAVYSTLERTDYMPLPLSSKDNNLKISIANAPEEEQFINSVKLVQVETPPNQQVLIDRHGQAFHFKQPQAFDEAIAGNADVKDLLYKDDANYSFNNGSGDLFLTYNNVSNSNARLIIRARNSGWSGYLFKEFNSLFGEAGDAWRSRQEKADPASLEKWQQDQALPIMVYIKQNNSWKLLDYFSLVGNTASRDQVMNLDLTGMTSGKLELKLSTVYRFWDLDYAALDLTAQQSLRNKDILPAEASTNKGTDEKNNLEAKDARYTQLTGEAKINFQFEVEPSRGFTYFLVSSGYYHSLKKYPGKMQTAALLPFRSKGTFNNFSRAKYQELNETLAKNYKP